MRRFCLSVLLGFGLSVAAQAAPVAFNWTGFYVGGNVGYGWGTGKTDTTVTGFLAPGGVIAHSDSLKLNGIVGGAQIGYNWQVLPNWVYGLEADWQASGEKASQSYSDAYANGLTAGTVATNFDAKISWFGTVRGRVGYAWDRLFFYGTGGLAYGQVKLAGTTMDSGVFIIFPYSGTAPFSASKVNVGWTLGAGIEGALVNKWTWKAEYLYVDLGSLDISAAGPFAGETITQHARFTSSIIRSGINYHF
jgi:outer membrane immunogenic protein